LDHWVGLLNRHSRSGWYASKTLSQKNSSQIAENRTVSDDIALYHSWQTVLRGVRSQLWIDE